LYIIIFPNIVLNTNWSKATLGYAPVIYIILTLAEFIYRYISVNKNVFKERKLKVIRNINSVYEACILIHVVILGMLVKYFYF